MAISYVCICLTYVTYTHTKGNYAWLIYSLGSLIGGKTLTLFCTTNFSDVCRSIFPYIFDPEAIQSKSCIQHSRWIAASSPDVLLSLSVYLCWHVCVICSVRMNYFSIGLFNPEKKLSLLAVARMLWFDLLPVSVPMLAPPRGAFNVIPSALVEVEGPSVLSNSAVLLIVWSRADGFSPGVYVGAVSTAGQFVPQGMAMCAPAIMPSAPGARPHGNAVQPMYRAVMMPGMVQLDGSNRKLKSPFVCSAW